MFSQTVGVFEFRLIGSLWVLGTWGGFFSGILQTIYWNSDGSSQELLPCRVKQSTNVRLIWCFSCEKCVCDGGTTPRLCNRILEDDSQRLCVFIAESFPAFLQKSREEGKLEPPHSEQITTKEAHQSCPFGSVLTQRDHTSVFSLKTRIAEENSGGAESQLSAKQYILMFPEERCHKSTTGKTGRIVYNDDKHQRAASHFKNWRNVSQQRQM